MPNESLYSSTYLPVASGQGQGQRTEVKVYGSDTALASRVENAQDIKALTIAENLIDAASPNPTTITYSCLLSTCPLHTISGCGKREAHFIWSMVTWRKAALVTGSTFEVYWPCAGGLSAVNAIGTQWRDPINSGRTQSRMAV